ncbi:hypothetical protein BUALT_Bualt07G0162500 [Buddleja alternifolia]|uniref:Protein EARLY FLOWERING 4 domain-containing protein n=1 Tax=Buddleja alternifolia TaxID=168488 RepID=A0AAV6XCG4_9LAMI|nr:hypothetical protein BUALT_Bualt07G0162500 [Buddleja alternifolia]
MEDDIYSMMANSTQIEGKVLHSFQKNFVQVQTILDQNRLLINEINQNHESKIPDNLSRNVGLIKELNNNIRRVVDLYADLSNSCTKSTDASSEGESAGTMKSDVRGILVPESKVWLSSNRTHVRTQISVTLKEVSRYERYNMRKVHYIDDFESFGTSSPDSYAPRTLSCCILFSPVGKRGGGGDVGYSSNFGIFQNKKVLICLLNSWNLSGVIELITD